MSPTVLISGASVAGPALAYWLHRHGFRPVVVERAGDVRGGGYPIDIRGVALDVAERMGVLPQLTAAHVGTRRITFVDPRGRVASRTTLDQVTGSPEGQDLEVPRGELTRVLYERTREDVEYMFDDSITAIDERPDGAHVTFRRGAPRTVDLVIGADGLHSNVRGLVFGPERDFRRDLGFHFAGFTMDDGMGLDREALFHNTPGRIAGWYAVGGQARSTAFLAFASPTELPFDPHDLDQQRGLVAAAFAGVGWEVPRMLAALRTADDLFFDSVSQIRMPRWASGRVALVGDAAYAPSFLSGQGTSMALVGAYVLAGELAAARGDHRVAFAAYERELRPFVERNQELAGTGTFLLIPATRMQAWLRDRLVGAMSRLGPLARRLNGRIGRVASSLELRDYPALPAAADTAAPRPADSPSARARATAGRGGDEPRDGVRVARRVGVQEGGVHAAPDEALRRPAPRQPQAGAPGAGRSRCGWNSWPATRCPRPEQGRPGERDGVAVAEREPPRHPARAGSTPHIGAPSSAAHR